MLSGRIFGSDIPRSSEIIFSSSITLFNSGVVIFSCAKIKLVVPINKQARIKEIVIRFCEHIFLIDI